jgi:hypothetical protein
LRRTLRLGLRAGAIYDLALGGFIWFGGRPVMEALGYPLPDHALFYFMLATLPLFLLPGLYLAAARAPDVDPFRGAVLWARGGGGSLLILCAIAYQPPPTPMFILIGVLDLAWAAFYYLIWRR